MRSDVFVLPAPGPDDEPGLFQSHEPILVQAFVTESSVERFAVGILSRLPGFNEVLKNLVVPGPFRHHRASKLGTIVRHDHRRLPAVKSSCGLSRSSLYARISQGLWPKPVGLGGRAVGWPSNEVAAIIAARIAGKSNEEVRQLVKGLEAARRLLDERLTR